ncbi:hypothetical protein HAX54_002267, partial [Datura stramonium]|nr:hypothetical protein [Datura stramonium]
IILIRSLHMSRRKVLTCVGAANKSNIGTSDISSNWNLIVDPTTMLTLRWKLYWKSGASTTSTYSLLELRSNALAPSIVENAPANNDINNNVPNACGNIT